jgi:hypothetical protein
MGVGPVAGTKFYIAQPGLPVGTYTEVKDIASYGDILAQFDKIKVESVGVGDSYELKGLRNFPSFDVTLNRNDQDAGQIALRTASAAPRGTLYNFKLDEGDTPPVLTATFTVTIATPGVFTQVAHGRLVGDAVSLSTTGALPTGLLVATTYYIKTVPTADTFTLSATPGGAAIGTSGTQSGIHTITTVPNNTISTWQGEVFGFGTAYGAPNTLKQVKTSISILPSTFLYVPAAE